MSDSVKIVAQLNAQECCQMHGGPGCHPGRCDECPRNAADLILSLESRISQQSRTIAEMCRQAAELERDAEILRTLIYRTHACDLKFNKQGGVSSLSATFKSNTVPGVGMSDGVRRYLDAFMQDAAIAAAKEGV